MQHDDFSSFDQSVHCFLALSLSWPSSLIKLSRKKAGTITGEKRNKNCFGELWSWDKIQQRLKKCTNKKPILPEISNFLNASEYDDRGCDSTKTRIHVLLSAWATQPLEKSHPVFLNKLTLLRQISQQPSRLLSWVLLLLQVLKQASERTAIEELRCELESCNLGERRESRVDSVGLSVSLYDWMLHSFRSADVSHVKKKTKNKT